MIRSRLQSGPFAERARRSVREIALAMALTLAALVFVVFAAVQQSVPETASIAPQEATQAQPN